MASQVMQLLGNHFDSMDPEYPIDVQPAWIPPLVDFLLLRFYTVNSPSYPGSIALHILSLSSGSSQFGTRILPILTLALSSAHPLQLRSWALKVFYKFMPGWFPPHMWEVPEEDLEKLLQAVGDPFKFTPSSPLYDGQSMDTADYDPMMVVVVLIEFASSDLWRNHLHRSHFTSWEEVISTEEGWRAALRSMSDTAAHTWPGFLSDPSKVIAAIGRLEELQCSNTVGVIASWARTAGPRAERGVFGGQDLEHPFGYTTWREAVGAEGGDKVIITEGSRRSRRTSPSSRSYTSSRNHPQGSTTDTYRRRGGTPDFHELHDEPITRPTTIADTSGPDFLVGVREARRFRRPGGDGYWNEQASYMYPCRGNKLTTCSLDF